MGGQSFPDGPQRLLSEPELPVPLATTDARNVLAPKQKQLIK